MLISDGYVNDVHSNEVWKYRKSVIPEFTFIVEQCAQNIIYYFLLNKPLWRMLYRNHYFLRRIICLRKLHWQKLHH